MNQIILILILTLPVLFILFKIIRKDPKRICFVYWHNPDPLGSSFVSLLKFFNSEKNRKLNSKSKEILELKVDSSIISNLIDHRISAKDILYIFIKNEQELELIPSLAPFKTKFLIWEKSTEKSCKNLIYIDESIEKLKQMIFLE